MPSFAQILTADENKTRSGFSYERMPTCFAKTMAASFEIDPQVASIFGDSESEDSFNGFGEISRDRGDISDIDLDDLEAEEDEASSEDAEVPEDHADDMKDEEAWWTAHLIDVQVPDFLATSGVNVNLNDPNELDVFLHFIGDDLWDLIVNVSNRYAQQKLGDKFVNFRRITREEFKAFIGVNMIMGIQTMPNYALFWSDDIYIRNQGIKATMTKNRFEELSCYLHFSNSSKEPARGDANYNSLFKVRAVLDYVRSKCENNFKPTKNIAVDEGMIGFRGRLSFRQYMPAKPTKYGIKVWMAADSSNGYVLNFDVYLGKEANQQRIFGLGYDVVTKLVRPFMNKNHHVYFDNFFSSLTLLEHLEANGTYACATVRCNRKDLPQCAKEKLRPGEKVVSQKGNVVFTKWHDKRDVSLISTNCSPLAVDVVVSRRNQDVSKPAVVDKYNKHMGGVDLADQLRQYYSIGRSSFKWYRYIFWFLMDISICNSFLLYNSYNLEQGKGKVPQLSFRLKLAKQLIGGFSSVSFAGHSAKRRKIDELALSSPNTGSHFIVKVQGRKKVCVHCKKIGRKTASVRAVESSFQCLQCSVVLCETCFSDFHTA